MEVETQAPVTSPEPENPNEQLEFELSKHASIALQARAMREKEEDREILELLTLLDKKVSSMEQRNLTRAASFSNALQSFVHNYFTQPNMVARDQTSTAKPAPARPPKTYAAATTASKPDSKTMRKPHTRSSKPERPLRLFLRLPTDHPARHASPHAALQKLRSNLDPAVTDTIKEIQHVPTGLAIGPKDGQSREFLLNKKEEIQQVIQGSNAEPEQRWAIFVIPGAIKQYMGYDGSVVTVSEQAAREEFKLQTGTMPLKLHWSRKNHEHNTGNTATMILAVPDTAASKIPPWIHFFGKNLRIKRKNINPRIQQCTRCWDFHSPRTCTRRPKCRLCGAKDHTEENHKESAHQCANCLGPAPADHMHCPVRPSIKHGILVRVPKSQIAAIRRIESGQRAQLLETSTSITLNGEPMPPSPHLARSRFYNGRTNKDCT
ncbi:hypothetical protein SI65_04381 [Aspergillus cristatus]|uniref:Uncharacterized protein n=1 Tax=Aspergillus cristatus TaxID=573508 RepID=A0A1E3BEP6_ASPCR|nr:hypothetical protein SI65_04381 [Aspergillus cristatus]